MDNQTILVASSCRAQAESHLLAAIDDDGAVRHYLVQLCAECGAVCTTTPVFPSSQQPALVLAIEVATRANGRRIGLSDRQPAVPCVPHLVPRITRPARGPRREGSH